jgi:hypothetical protein
MDTYNFFIFFQVIPFDVMNEDMGIIKEATDVLKYKECYHKIGTHFKHPHFYLGMVANLLLFHSTPDMNLKEEKRIAKIFEEAKRLLKVGCCDLADDIGM